MARFSWRKWFGFETKVNRPGRLRKHARPRLEQLEDRLAPATAGTLDPTFFGHGLSGAVDGISYRGLFNADFLPYAASAVEANGQIVFAGTISGGITVQRLNPDGSPNGQFVTLALFPNYTAVTAVSADPSGDILIAVEANATASALVRFTPTGTLDTTFGNAGVVSVSAVIDALTTDSSGKVYAAGSSGLSQIVERFTSTGAVDNLFGSSGVFSANYFNLGGAYNAIALDSSGRVVVAGYTNFQGRDSFSVARLTSGGAYDPTFNSFATGFINFYISPSADDIAYALTLQPDGNILVAGQSGSGSTGQVAIARLLGSNGAFDSTFINTYGRANFAQLSAADRMALQSNGSILLEGREPSGGSATFGVLRLTPGGGIDSSYGSGGVAGFELFDPANILPGYANGTAPVIGAPTGIYPLPDGRVVIPGALQTYWNADGVISDGREFYGTGVVVTCLRDGGRTLDVNDPAGTAVTSLSPGSDRGNAVAVQSDGKIVVAGATAGGGFGLVRYNADGSLDTTFGANGIVNTSFPGLSDASAWSIALQGDGMILVGGSANNGPVGEFVLARYTSAGVLDSSFGTGGKTVAAFAGYSYAAAAGLAIQADGSIVVVGKADSGSAQFFALARYTSAGVLDASFGTNGEVVSGVAGFNVVIATGVAIQADGKIVLVGYASNGSIADFALARYTSAGTLDSSFGTGGETVSPFAGFLNGDATGLAILTDGKIVVGGYAYGGPNGGFALAQYTSTGALDSTFGTNGEVVTPFPGFGNPTARGLAVQSDGKLVLAGSVDSGIGSRFALARYTQGGVLDASFGTSGQVVTPIAGFRYAAAYAVAIQPDNNIVAAGYAMSGNGFDPSSLSEVAVARYDVPAEITSTSPCLTGATLAAGTTSLQVNFSKPVVGANQASNYQLQSVGPDGLLGTADDVIVPLAVSYSGTTATLTFSARPSGVYWLTVKDNITDAAGNKLDGDGDGTPGGNYMPEAPGLVVTTLADVADPYDGQTSLREAIAYANTLPGPNTITFQPGLTGTITLTGGVLTLTDTSGMTTIQGPGANLLTIDGNNASTVFSVSTGASATLDGLTIAHGSASFGAGVHNDGTLAVSNSTLTGNAARLDGGGVSNDGVLMVSNSTFWGNSARSGGGIVSSGGLTVNDSTFSGNSASFAGGGIYAYGGETVASSTFSGNTSPNIGGLYVYSGPLSLTNTILANSQNGAADLFIAGGSAVTFQHNLIQTEYGGNYGNGVNGNMVGQDPLLAPLGNYGGPTQTFALLPGSPALDAGSNTAAAGLTTDQRGQARISGGAVDIGAFESRGFSVSLSGGGQSATVNTAFADPLTATVSSPYGEPVVGGQVRFAAPASGASADLSASSVTLAASGQASVSATANGTPGNYAVTASAGGAWNAAATLTNLHVNHPPVAADDTASAATDRWVTVAVLANDSDPDGDPLTVQSVTSPAHGSVVINLDGTVTYTPALHYHGADSFTYTIADGLGGAATATVNLSVFGPNLFTVTTAADDGPGSLRQAILEANATANDPAGPDIIQFQIGSGLQTITPLSALPTITDAVTIDGWSQPGFAGTPLIELDGESAGNGHGLSIQAPDTTIRGLVINRFSYDAIALFLAPNAWIAGNYIGTDPTGLIAEGNGSGIIVGYSNGAIIGANGEGNDLLERNLISANGGDDGVGIGLDHSNGVTVRGNYLGTDITGSADISFVHNSDANINVSYSSNPNILDNLISGGAYYGITLFGDSHPVVQGNLIGTNGSGTRGLGNTYGIWSDFGTHDALIGGTSAGAGNVISGNGIGIIGYDSPNMTIQGNLVGTDATGSYAILNQVGVTIGHAGSTNVLIGGTTPGAGNVISGNVQGGINVAETAGPVWIEGNAIGTDKDRRRAIGNGLGIWTRTASGVTVGGPDPADRNLISGNTGSGVVVETQGNLVEGNYVGTDDLGTAAIPNLGGGVEVGGTADAVINNLVSGNDGFGILVGGTGSLVQGNTVGTDLTGTVAVPNHGPGLTLYGSHAGLIGGPGAGQGNLISGNTGNGIDISYPSDSSGNRVQGNRIGTNAAGTAALGNGQDGVFIYYLLYDDNVIGGTNPGEGNVISGNLGNGITILGSSITIQGNAIGTDAGGTLQLGNAGDGVLATRFAHQVAVGGVGAGQGNTIAYNGQSGVEANLGAMSITVRGNSIHDNARLGLDLNYGGNAGNNNQSYPTLTAAEAGPITHVAGSLASAPNSSFLLDFYANASPSPSGFGEGQRYLGTLRVTTDAGGNAGFDAYLLATTAPGEAITATATDAAGNTSGFSPAVGQASFGPVNSQILQTALNQFASATVPTGATTPIAIVATFGPSVQIAEADLDIPQGIRVRINGGTWLGGSPALTLAGGDLTITGATFVNSTDAPTILVTGGKLVLRDDVVQESTGFHQAAIRLTGGFVDLGTAADPGGNTLEVNGPGDLVYNTSGNAVATIGDTLQADGSRLTDPDQIAALLNPATTTILSTSDSSPVYGQPVLLTATVAAAGNRRPAGTVTFLDGSTVLGTGVLQVTGGVAQATLAVASLTAGSHTLTAVYAGDDLFVPSSSVGVTEAVGRAMPTVSWTTPADITYGTALDATQLNATATVFINGSPVTVPGTFAYSSPSGTVLHAGSGQTLSVTFTPADTTDYATATQSVPINVTRASVTVSVAGGTFTFDTLAHGATSNSVTGAGGLSTTASLAYYSGAATDAAHLLSGAPTDPGTYTVVASYAGDANHLAGSASATITIAAPGVVTVSVVGGNLLVVGTDNADAITINATDATHASVSINGGSAVAYAFAAGGHIIVYGQGGNDAIVVNGNVNAELHGGGGNDTLTGGAGDDVIWGDGGDDVITGSAGNDVLIGGAGSDRLVGSAGHDLLISGELTGTHNGGAYDYAALRAISDAWAALWTPDTDLSSANDDVLDEAGSSDMLTGSSGHDWFIIGSTDRITDANSVIKDGDKITYV
jgi:uncharacterized delta-60 repeat protein/CSLREA domain-containing protein